MSLAQLLLLRQGGASGTLPLEETCCEEEGSAMFALAGLVPGQWEEYNSSTSEMPFAGLW